MALRTISISSQPLWGDEALTLVRAQWPAGALLFQPVDPTGGLYYVLHKLLIAEHASVAAIRSISAIAGTLSILALFGIGRLSFGTRGALFAAALLALSPPLVDYSQEARAYSLLILLVLLSALGLIAWDRRIGRSEPGLPSLLLFAAATVLAFYTHPTSVFWIIPAVIGGAVLTFVRGSATDRRLYVLVALWMAMLALPEIRRVGAYESHIARFSWLEQADVQLFGETLAEAYLPALLWDNDRFSAGWTLSLASILVSVAVIAWRLATRRAEVAAWARGRPGSAITTAILVSAPVGIWLFGFAANPIFMPRTILIGIPGFVLLVVLLIELDKAWWVAGALITAFAAALVVGGTVRQKEGWTVVAGILDAHARPGDSVIVCPYWKYPAFRHSIARPPDVHLLIPGSGELLILEKQLGTSPRWIRDFFQINDQRHGWTLRKRPYFRAGRAWVVVSQCGDSSQTEIRRWLGIGRWSHVGHVPPPRHHDGINIWLFEGPPKRGTVSEAVKL